MIEIGPYPFVASFFPEHFVIPLITLLVFLILLYALANIRRIRKGFSVPELTTSDVAAIFGLIIGIVSPLVIPFSQLPVIDYSVALDDPISTGGQIDNQTIKVTIHIYGVVAAKNIIISMSANNTEFGKPTSTPYLGKELNSTIPTINVTEGGQIGRALLQIEALPARSHTIIEIPVKSLTGNPSELSTYVQSDAAVGYYQTIYLFLFYAILAFIYLAMALILAKMHMEPLIGKKTIKNNTVEYVKLGKIIIYGIFIFIGIVAANILLYLPYTSIGNFFYSILSFVGIVVLPLFIIITAIASSSLL